MEIALPWFDLVLDLPPENVLMLIFLASLTFLTYFYMRRFRKERTTKLGNFETLKEVHGHKTAASLAVLGMKITIVLLLFLAATNAVEVRTEYSVPDTDYVIAFDSSPSMTTYDYEPTRFEYAQEQTVKYIERMPKATNISVLTFSDTSTTISGFEEDPDETVDDLEDIEPDLENPGSSVASAVTQGTDSLTGSGQDKSLIIFTDGMTDSEEDFYEAVSYADENDVNLYFIGIEDNQQTQELYQELEESFEDEFDFTPDEDSDSALFQEASERTGGSYYEIRSEGMFDAALEDIVIEQDRLGLDSDYIILVFIALLVITEIWVYSRYGAL